MPHIQLYFDDNIIVCGGVGYNTQGQSKYISSLLSLDLAVGKVAE